ncbi:hypothetical protein EfmGK923_21430 [Enterococcus faecium]|nr:hypothetical protein EfmGK923_21430 [Enterococcus faecium]
MTKLSIISSSYNYLSLLSIKMLTTFAREARVKGKYRISTFLAIEIGIKYLKCIETFFFFLAIFL